MDEIIEFLKSSAVQEINREVTHVWQHHNGGKWDIREYRDILYERKKFINDFVLQRQEVMLPYIIAFNERVMRALKRLYNRAEKILKYNQADSLPKSMQAAHVEAMLYLPEYWPDHYPVRMKNADMDFWEALTDGRWNEAYHNGIINALYLGITNARPTFEEWTLMDVESPNWNEHLDPGLTKDLLLSFPFKNLFVNSAFALIDFVFCRKFEEHIYLSYVK